MTLYHYVNGNKVVEAEKGNIDAAGKGSTKMLSKSKSVSVLKSDTDIDDGYALLYACATDWWMIIPRKFESAWIMSRKESIDDSLHEELKKVVELNTNYDVSERWGEHTFQGADCKYNKVLTLKRAAEFDNTD